jgi:hypothetical protein
MLVDIKTLQLVYDIFTMTATRLCRQTMFVIKTVISDYVCHQDHVYLSKNDVIDSTSFTAGILVTQSTSLTLDWHRDNVYTDSIDKAPLPLLLQKFYLILNTRRWESLGAGQRNIWP